MFRTRFAPRECGRRHAKLFFPVLLAVVFLCFHQAIACDVPESPVVDYSGQSPYVGPHGHRIKSEERAETNDKLRQPIYRFLDHVLRDADRYQLDRDLGARACALTWIETWAAGHALLGEIRKQGRYERQWTLASVAIAYLKLGKSPDPASHQRIVTWMTDVARQVITFDRDKVVRNNHHYYAGLAIAATAIAADDEQMWNYARSVYIDAMDEIQDNGMLPRELARGSRATGYHQFATGPLVTMALFSRLKGEDFFALRDGRIHKLVALVANAVADPSLLERINGERQGRPRNVPWWPLYAKAFSERAAKLPQPSYKSYDRHLGGDTGALMSLLGL